MRKTKNIWTVTCQKTKKDFVVTKHTDNIIYDIKENEVAVITETDDKKYDLILNNKFYRIIDTLDVFGLSNLAKLFESRSVRFKKVNRSWRE